MTTKAETSSRHLGAARELLDEIEQSHDADPQTKATAAIAHSVLVLAEQVAAARVMMVSDAVSQRSNGETTPQA
jgi:hypothetical protein